MTSKTFALGALTLLAAASIAPGALAQSRRAAAAAAAAAPVRTAATPGASAITGPALPGVCVYSNERAIASSSVGQAFRARMQQLAQQAQAEITQERNSLETDARAFQGRQASLTQQQREQQAAPLQQRYQALQTKTELREREMQATINRQLGRIQEQLTPAITQISAARNCSVVLNGDGAVVAANPGMDLTPAAVQQLNSRMSTITFDRENLANQSAAATRR